MFDWLKNKKNSEHVSLDLSITQLNEHEQSFVQNMVESDQFSIPLKPFGVDKFDSLGSHTPIYRSDIAKISHIVAVASGKGGVGKSTTSVNLARSLQQLGARVGVLDADIYGPSIPKMLGVETKRPESFDGKIMQPVESEDGLFSNSIGYLIQQDDAAIWRGPMASRALEQLFNETAWGELDYLIIDLPPGTGDIQLTLSQKLPLSAAVIVSTPQDIALIDAIKAFAMFEKVDVKTLGLVENMSVHICSNCGHESHIFGQDGVKNLASKKSIQFLGEAPLSLELREFMDNCQQTALSDMSFSKHYQVIALRTAIELAKLATEKQQENGLSIPITEIK
ncbi:iron-sulfur cluster carrier protein ApbC [Catenovulum sp. SM1970]|uniref:iron-sulfur cluster carrier protein ApbC n=1 Tax=Marinifaba aquimaris TaxID=2741323 RepID=UPI00157481D4|nr:iron-sulfur cluster carrier protein ApbC [Marinifaba aquimaris]NTS77321.1 iron-sulfur cluster carrier protein ApbC [Marinifaba aquimaris]